MTNRFGRLGVVAALAITVAAVAAGGALADQSYTDPSGDAGPGTDLTSMTVRNDQAGLVTFQLASASPIVANHAVAVFIDADKNPATGAPIGPVGVDYWMFGGPETGVAFLAWNGSDFVEANAASFFVGAAAQNVTEFRLNRSDMGNTAGFNFLAISISIDGETVNFWDIAGPFTYDLVFPQCGNGKDDDGDGKIDSADLGCSSATDENEADDPVNIRLGKAKTTPAAPKAGRSAVVSAGTTRVETGQPLDGGTVTCTARIVGGKALKGTGSLVAGRAQCKLKIPADAKKKTVRGQIAMTYQTATAKTPFIFRTAAA